MRAISSQKAHWLIPVSILVFGLTLRVYQLDSRPLWSDEIDVLQFSSAPLAEMLDNFSRGGWNGPLYYLIIRYWKMGVGDSIFSLRYFSVLMGVITIALAWKFGRIFTNKSTRLSFVVLVATSPYLVWYSQDGKMYGLLLMLSVFGFILFQQIIDQNRFILLPIYIVTLVIGWYVHIMAVLTLPIHLIYWLYRKGNFTKKFILQFLGLIGLLSLLNFPLLRWQVPLLFSDFLTGHPITPLATIIQTQLFLFSGGFPTNFQLVPIFIIVVLFLVGLLFNEAVSVGNRGFLFLYFVIPILAIYIISLGMPIYADRYVITSIVGFYSIVALGITCLISKNRFLGYLVVFAIVVFNTLTVFQQSNV